MLKSRKGRLAQRPAAEHISDVVRQQSDEFTPPNPHERWDQSRTFAALNAARRRALHISDYDLTRDRYIILSDTHKGMRGRGTDEFQENEPIYCEALDYYLDQDYRLVLNGDIEEGWKASYDSILKAYADTAYLRERAFADRGEGYYLRTYGNHDLDWADPALADTHLRPFFGRRIRVHPAVVLGGKIFITHGHQGDYHSDQLIWLSRRIIRYIWKPIQRLVAIQWQRAAVNGRISSRRDQLLRAWAQANHMLLIAGHTHRPVLHLDNPAAQLHYVNDGCCLHKGAITGVELDRGVIRLVRWQGRADTALARLTHAAERVVFQQTDLESLLARL